jgi:hypothetical protein
VVDGSVARGDERRGPASAPAWLSALAGAVGAVYGWADWETATFLVAAPMRRDIAAGTIGRLFRVNFFGPALLTRTDEAALIGRAVWWERTPESGLVLLAGAEERSLTL